MSVLDSPHSTSGNVLGSEDIVTLVLRAACLPPASFAACSCVCRTWRLVCRIDEQLLMTAAMSQAFLTKRMFMSLFALSSSEADCYPRGMRARRQGGFMHMYMAEAVRTVLTQTGGMPAWRRRVESRLQSNRSDHRMHVKRYWNDDTIGAASKRLCVQ